MANPDGAFNGQGETLDPLLGTDGTVYLKAAGHPINVAGATDDSAPHLVQDYPGQYTLTPTGLALAQGSGTLGAATYFYRVSATTAAGETLACAEVGLAIGATTGVILTWDAMAGATGYRVYGRATGAELFIASVSGATLTYTDDGSVVTPAGALPSANTARIGQLVETDKAATGAVTTVAGSASSVVLLAANTARKGATITNDSSAVLYVKLAASAASTTSYTVTLAGAAAAPFAYYECPFSYVGEIRGIWASATGNARLTELT